MSKLRRADYSEHLVGKTLKRVHWCNDEQRKCLTLEFTDQALCSFRFELAVDEEVELLDFASGNPPKQQKLIPQPLVRQPIKALERE
jgi:hypothetical protein